MTTHRYGFRILGPITARRRLVDAGVAFAAYAACDPRAECDSESYLSAFQYGDDFGVHLDETGSTKGYSGPCWSPWLWFDFDSDELGYAHADAGATAAFMVDRFGIDPGCLLLFFSGSKGFHLGLPTAIWTPVPSVEFHRTARRFAERIADLAAVTIDSGVYDRVRAFRAPNSKHPKTGLHKRRLTYDELLGTLDRILELATKPAPFDLPMPTATSDQASADWQQAADQAGQEAQAKAARRAVGTRSPTLNRSTLDFIRDGARQGERHRLLFSAAANLAEFGCTPALAVALLEESALDSGLAPKEVRRQVECGLAAVSSPPAQQDARGAAPTATEGATVQEPLPAAADHSGGSGGQACERATGGPPMPPTPDRHAALGQLRGRSLAPRGDQTGAGPQVWGLDAEAGPAVLPPVPPPVAVGSGTRDTPRKDFPTAASGTTKEGQ